MALGLHVLNPASVTKQAAVVRTAKLLLIEALCLADTLKRVRWWGKLPPLSSASRVGFHQVCKWDYEWAALSNGQEGRGLGSSPGTPARQDFMALLAEATTASGAQALLPQLANSFPGAQPAAALPGHGWLVPRRPEEALPAPHGRQGQQPGQAAAALRRPTARRDSAGRGLPGHTSAGRGAWRRLATSPVSFHRGGMRSEAAPHPGGLERFDSAGKGRGLRARRRYAVGELLFSCPAYASVLTVSERGSHCDGCFAR